MPPRCNHVNNNHIILIQFSATNSMSFSRHKRFKWKSLYCFSVFFSVWNSNLLSVISQHACHSLQILKPIKLWNQDLVVWRILISCESFQNGQRGAGQSSWVPRSPGQRGPDGEQSQGNQVQEWMTENSPGHGADPALCSLSVWAKHLTLLSMSLKRLVSAWPRPLSSVDTSDKWHSEETSNSLQGLQGTARPATHLPAPGLHLSTPVPSPPCGSTTHLQAGLLPRSRLAVCPVHLLGEAHRLKPPTLARPHINNLHELFHHKMSW